METNEKIKKVKKGIRPPLLLALSFVSLIAVGTFLLSLPVSNNDGKWLPFVSALFTSTSAVCVTGLSVFDIATQLTTLGQVFLLLLIQLGGLGLMTVASLLFIFIGKKITLKDRLVLKEAYGEEGLTGLLRLTKYIVFFTLIMEITGAIILSFSFIPRFGFADGLWKSVFHSVSAFCNAGFDLLGTNASLTAENGNFFVLLPIMLLITIGGLGFAVIQDLYRNKFRFKKCASHTKVVLATSASLVLVGFIVFLLSEWNNENTMKSFTVFEKLYNSLFQSVTTRTAGFASVDQASLSPLSRVFTMLFMLIGASPASTGGGIKTTTLFVLIFTFFAGAKGQEDITAFGKTVKHKTVYKAFAIFVFALMVVFTLSAAIFSVENGRGNAVSYEAALFESFSAFATVGLTEGITQSLSPLSLCLLAVVMLVGRLGTLFLGLMFVEKLSVPIKYPEYKINLG